MASDRLRCGGIAQRKNGRVAEAGHMPTNQAPDTRPYSYYTVMRQSQDPKVLRLRMALYARDHGVKPAARAFKTSVKTVRKWLSRFDGKIASLEEKSRAPKRRPRKLGVAAEKKILDAKRRCPRFSARRLKL